MASLPTRVQVIRTLFEKWGADPQTEIIEADDALYRVPSADVYAKVSIPVVRASGMDGVGVRSEQFTGGMPDTSSWKQGVDFCRADTGDDFDDRFDAVIPIERASLSTEGILIIDPDVTVTRGMNIRPCGDIVKEGDVLAKKDRSLRPFDLACLAAGGVTQVGVYRKPRVAFVPTGSELIPPGTALRRGNTFDSNSTLVKHLLREMGAEPLCFPIVPDDRTAVEAALDDALRQADAVILNGGSSKGAEDYNARLLEEKGVALFHWVAAAPGKPMCVALVGNKPVINMPGPPIAVLYGMDWCIRAIVDRLLCKPTPRRPTIKGVLTEEIMAPSDMEILCMMDVRKAEGGYEVKQKPWKRSNVAESLGAGAIYITKLGLDGHKAGEALEVELLRGEEDFDC